MECITERANNVDRVVDETDAFVKAAPLPQSRKNNKAPMGILQDLQERNPVLAVVGVAAALIDIGDLSPLLGGCVLFVGCLVVLMGAVLRAARHQKAVTASRTA